MRGRLLILLMPIAGLFGQPSFTEHQISTAWEMTIHATDIDQDGDIDILSSTIEDDKIFLSSLIISLAYSSQFS